MGDDQPQARSNDGTDPLEQASHPRLPVVELVAERSATRDRRVASISVDALHGRYSYKLRAQEPESFDAGRLLVLYGDNGSGKTSILRLLFHLLAAAPGRGHRTTIAKSSFRSFYVEFSDGHRIGAERSGPDLVGPYSLVMAGREGEIAKVEVLTNDIGAVRGHDNDQLDRFYEAVVETLGVEPFLVGDDRRLHADSLPTRPFNRRSRYIEDERGRITVIDPDEIDSPSAELILTLERATQWIRQQALGASNRSSENANAIYTDLLKRFAQPAESQLREVTVAQSLKKLLELAERNAEYEKFGLVPRLTLEPIVDAVKSAGPERAEAVQGLLQPFLEVLEARLSAVQSLQESVASYEDALNSFYWDKRVRVSLRSGIEIETLDGIAIPPEALSSGERQLLMVLTNVLFARDGGALFIIDEPEISLNMKWQRRLVDSLLSCTRMSGAQFILATHSFEILSGHRDRIVHLVPQPATGPLMLDLDRE